MSNAHAKGSSPRSIQRRHQPSNTAHSHRLKGNPSPQVQRENFYQTRAWAYGREGMVIVVSRCHQGPVIPHQEEPNHIIKHRPKTCQSQWTTEKCNPLSWSPITARTVAPTSSHPTIHYVHLGTHKQRTPAISWTSARCDPYCIRQSMPISTPVVYHVHCPTPLGLSPVTPWGTTSIVLNL